MIPEFQTCNFQIWRSSIHFLQLGVRFFPRLPYCYERCINFDVTVLPPCLCSKAFIKFGKIELIHYDHHLEKQKKPSVNFCLEPAGERSFLESKWLPVSAPHPALKYVKLPPLLSLRDICMTFALKLASQDILSNAGLVVFLARTVTFHSYKPVWPLYSHSNFTFIIKIWCGEMLQEFLSTLEVILRRPRVKKTRKVASELEKLVYAFSCLVFSMLLFCSPSFLSCPLIHPSITPPLFIFSILHLLTSFLH